jgi:hypothetical protein
VEYQSRIIDVGILKEMIDPAGVEAAGSPLNTVNLVPLLQQQLGQIGAILTSDPSDEGCFITAAMECHSH